MDKTKQWMAFDIKLEDFERFSKEIVFWKTILSYMKEKDYWSANVFIKDWNIFINLIIK